MGRRLQTTLPQTTHHLIPKWPYLPEFKRADKLHKDRIKEDFDRRHRVHSLPEIPNDQDVWVSSEGASVPGTVVSPARTTKSYIMRTAAGEIRRNRSHLRVMPETTEGPTTEQAGPLPQSSPIITRSRTGVVLRPPERLA